jgi:hypothetical protein
MARSSSWFVLCLALALVLLPACSGSRPTGGCCPAPDCAPACEVCSDEPGPQPCDRPPEAKAGEAWCRVWVPPVTKTVLDRVVVCPARCNTIKIPAEYGSRPTLVCVNPARVKEIVKPAVWTTKREVVCVRPAREVFRRVKCETGVANGCEKQGDCWVKEECPPVFETRERRVCVAPPKKTLEYTPARYELREERFLSKPAGCGKETIPATYEDRSRTVCVAPGHWVWRHNTACEVPEEGLPALEVEMVDSDPSGGEAGVFEQGGIVRYDLTIRSDVGSEAFPTIKVQFTLPPQLEFISGEGMGVAITGSGQSADSSSFKLSLEQEVQMHILARVLSVPPTAYVQMTASVQTAEGEELASETESTTLAKAAEKK